MKHLLLIFSLLVSVHFTYSQYGYYSVNAVNSAGTYTDLGTTGTVIVTPGFDDDNSAAQNIGFSFSFNGTAFTQFVLNTNGVIKLGATAPAATNLYDALASTETNLIYPLNLDLVGGTAPEYRLFTSGMAPNRVCTIQFKNVQDYFQSPATAPQFANMDFQIKLYETSNTIEFVYGTFVAGGAPSALTYTEVGIKGSNVSNSLNVVKSSAAAWTTAVFLDGDYDYSSGVIHNIRNTVLPVAGRTYRFVPFNNDAHVATVYTLGKIPLGFGSPHTVKSIVKNSGANTLTNLAVTLNITGANTFSNTQTVASLASGAAATVSFAAFSPANIGTNSVTVSVAADENNVNNMGTISQAVNSGTFSYADNSVNTNSVGYNAGTDGLFLNKYTMTGMAYVTSVNIFIPNVAANAGNTIYAVVLDAAGVIIGQSANYVIAAGDFGTYKSLPVLVAPVINSADFFVGLAQPASAGAFFPLALQTENPARSGAYFTAPLAGGVAPTENTTLGRFMLEAVIASSPLAIKLSDFTGIIKSNATLLNWNTSYEHNNDRFEVEKSPAGSGNWLTIGTVSAVGNTATTTKYQFIDGALTAGKWAYRLKIFDKEGKFAYSPIVLLQVTGKSVFVLEQNYPNPVKDITAIHYQLGKDAIVTIELYGIDGKKIMAQQKGRQLKGAYTLSVDAESLGLSNGKYIYRMVVQDVATGEVNTLNKEMNVIR